MKTAISVRDPLFQRVERFAKRERMSRSQVFSKAAEEYLDKHDAEDITANLNAVYENQDSSVDPVLLRMALMSLPKEEW